ncbi:MAG: SDR family NAD(P)-dependent oxidoreductase [Candidatus Binatia bacterium]
MSDVAIVSGGANGIGRSVCLRFSRSEILVVIVDHDREAAGHVKDEVNRAGGNAEVYLADVRNAVEVKRVVAEVFRRYGRIDILANLVGGSIHVKSIDELSWAEWKEVLDVNLKGTFLVCREVAPIMIGQGRGRIVNTASNYGLTGCALRTPYSAAKAGVVGFSKSLAQELAPHGVLVNLVAPGPTDTPRILSRSTPQEREKRSQEIPKGRTAKPEEIAEAFYFLVGPESAYMTGQTLHVNGGLVMP